MFPRLKAVAVLVGLFIVAGCEGPMGPAGPAGPQGAAGAQGLPGPVGPAGAGTRANYTATINMAGQAGVTLPAAAGNDINRPPSLACYMGSTTDEVWIAVGDGNGNGERAVCGLVFQNGVWTAGLIQGIPGWIAAFVVMY